MQLVLERSVEEVILLLISGVCFAAIQLVQVVIAVQFRDKMLSSRFFSLSSNPSLRIAVLAVVERASEDLVDRDFDDIDVDDEDFNETVVSVDAGDVPAFCTLTFLRFGVLPTPELKSFG